MKVLNALGEELAYRFLNDFGDRGCCSCFISPPCGYCTHEGNPDNLEYQDDVWQEVWDLDEACEQARKRLAEALDMDVKLHWMEYKLDPRRFGLTIFNPESSQ